MGAAPGAIETRYWKTWHTIKVDNSGKQEDKAEPVPQVAVAASAQPGAMRLYVGPKDYDDLKQMNPPLQSLVNFGWLEIVADPLFHALKWIHNYIPNWGWAIVILTLVINMLLFPLRISSYKTTMKMQRVGPEMKAIQEKYKKYKMNDPRKAEMNQEVMAVYSREGHQSAWADACRCCLQMPIWFGLNTALSSAIEMRHAPWFGWITDLSSKDPYYILPVVMGGIDVSGVKDDADDHHRSAAADDDEIHAAFVCGNVYDVSDFERTGSVYFDQQPGGHRAAVVFESDASRDRRCRQSTGAARSPRTVMGKLSRIAGHASTSS